jgi:hypothetical protein
MIDKFFFYVTLLLNSIEEGRSKLYEMTAPWIEKREIVADFFRDVESRLKVYNPLTLILGFMVMIILSKWIIRKIKNIWNSISKI